MPYIVYNIEVLNVWKLVYENKIEEILYYSAQQMIEKNRYPHYKSKYLIMSKQLAPYSIFDSSCSHVTSIISLFLYGKLIANRSIYVRKCVT